MQKQNVLSMLGIKYEPSTRPINYKLDEGNSYVVYFESLPADIRVDEKLFEEMWKMHPKEFGKMQVADKIVDTPRWTKGYDLTDYLNGKIKGSLSKCYDYFIKLATWVRKHSGKPYSELLINWYRDENHHIGWHSDSRDQLIPNSDIYSFSFGATRDFTIKSKLKKFKKNFSLAHNSVLIMGGEMQTYYLHSVPKPKKKCGRRINITFRMFME